MRTVSDELGALKRSANLKMSALLSVIFLCFCDLSVLRSFASNPQPEPVLVSGRRTFFVAVNGSDANPGTNDLPWATVNHAADQVVAGDMVFVRDGRYALTAQVRPRNSGRPDAWITFVGYPGESPILDARMVQRAAGAVLNNGAFQIEGVSHIRVANLTVVNSHDAGFTIRDSSDIDLINNSTNETFSSGIAVWDTNHDRTATKRIRILANSITKATTWSEAPPELPKRGEPPHEALSIGGAVDFEVAYNHVYDSDKEGIDIKETSSRGKVHHNLVHNTLRQGIYVDAWFGELSDIEIFSNVIHDCGGAGFALSVENGTSVHSVDFHDNLIFNNKGSGMYVSRWGVDLVRRNIRVTKNIFYRNGYGSPAAGQTYFWQTGGLYLYSPHVENLTISRNIFYENRGFQIGYSELFLKGNQSWQAVARKQKIDIDHNLIFRSDKTQFPIESGGAPFDRVRIYAVDGDHAIFGKPLFKDPGNGDFTAPNAQSKKSNTNISTDTTIWWKRNSPPKLIRTAFD